jgi:hypothetical protein
MTGDRILHNPGRHTVDEIVCRNVDLHLEQTTPDSYHMNMWRNDRLLTVRVDVCGPANRKQWLEVTVEDESPNRPWPWDEEREHEETAP